MFRRAGRLKWTLSQKVCLCVAYSEDSTGVQLARARETDPARPFDVVWGETAEPYLWHRGIRAMAVNSHGCIAQQGSGLLKNRKRGLVRCKISNLAPICPCNLRQGITVITRQNMAEG